MIIDQIILRVKELDAIRRNNSMVLVSEKSPDTSPRIVIEPIEEREPDPFGKVIMVQYKPRKY